jgi:hypothetical protein
MYDESLKARCILNDELLKHLRGSEWQLPARNNESTNSRQDNVDACQPTDRITLKALKRSTTND